MHYHVGCGARDADLNDVRWGYRALQNRQREADRVRSRSPYHGQEYYAIHARG
jgi:hypothetical protein